MNITLLCWILLVGTYKVVVTAALWILLLLPLPLMVMLWSLLFIRIQLWVEFTSSISIDSLHVVYPSFSIQFFPDFCVFWSLITWSLFCHQTIYCRKERKKREYKNRQFHYVFSSQSLCAAVFCLFPVSSQPFNSVTFIFGKNSKHSLRHRCVHVCACVCLNAIHWMVNNIY